MNKKIFIHFKQKRKGKNMDMRKKIYQSAKKSFVDKGFKKTNIAGIMDDVGMAVGSFYNYYQSKEEVFIEIFLDENRKQKKKLLKNLDLDLEPKIVITQIIEKNYEGMRKNSILSQWYDQYTYQIIEKVFKDKGGLSSVDFIYDFFTDIIEKWQGDGKIRKDIDVKVIMKLFYAMIFIDANKNEIGFSYFPELTTLLADFIIQGLETK
jgi:AcrR family transcriptional regulator